MKPDGSNKSRNRSNSELFRCRSGTAENNGNLLFAHAQLYLTEFILDILYLWPRNNSHFNERNAFFSHINDKICN